MAETTTAAPATRPFSPFEWMLAGRYLRARRKEGFISVIAGFSFVGIMLGVATLIIVMAVMNGFRKDLFAKILGLNGHVIVHKIGEPFEDYPDVRKRIEEVSGVKVAIPLIEGQVMVSSAIQAAGGLVRGIDEAALKKLPLVYDNVRTGSFEGFDEGAGIAIGQRLATQLRVMAGDTITLVSPRGAATPFGTAPRSKPYLV
ncbi:MAG: ABC transporter permease, partial [Hyphomicrobiaceae bacterium]